MQDLIRRLEQATAADRELDALIEGEVRRFQAYAAGISDEHRSKWLPVGAKGEVQDEQNTRYHSPPYTFSLSTAHALLPWADHPGSTFTLKTIQSGRDEFYCFAEFTWPSTERKGRSRLPEIATVICALYAIEETERVMAPFRNQPAKRRSHR